MTEQEEKFEQLLGQLEKLEVEETPDGKLTLKRPDDLPKPATPAGTGREMIEEMMELI
jgi:hypothetical protein